MTITTDVRIHWPVPAIALLDHVTRVAGGDPAVVRRRVLAASAYNAAGQGLRTLAGVTWGEALDTGDVDEEEPPPPALVTLWIDNPVGGVHGPSGVEVQAYEILPAVVGWLDDQGVPRDRWWWEDEYAGTWHPGTTDVRLLAENGEREAWEPDE